MKLDTELEAIFVRIGLLLHVVQITENLTRLVMTYVIQKDSPLTLEKLETLQGKERTKTLGYFICELNKRVDLDDGFGETLSRFLDMRNKFVHNHDEIPGWCLDTDDGRKVAHAFLAEFHRVMEAVTMVFLGLVRSWEEQIGMTVGDDLTAMPYFRQIDTIYKPLADDIFFGKE